MSVPGFESDRLTAEEATEVARLHAERSAARERALQHERERLAGTAAPEEIAATIGATPEEVRELAAEVRRNAERKVVPYRSHPVGLALAILFMVLVLVAMLATSIPAGR